MALSTCPTVRGLRERGEQMNTADFLRRLDGVKRSGKGWMARCPAHDDHNPSLSITETSDGKTLLKCFAGCQPEQVVSAVGLEMKDLFPAALNNGENVGRSKAKVATATAARIAHVYDYVDERGELLYQVCRKEPKDFSQRRRDEKGKLIWGLNAGVYAQHPNGDWLRATDRTPSNYPRRKFDEARRVPYRLPMLLAADPQTTVFIVEGEKDADRLASLWLVATTNVGGAGNWRDEYSEHLSGRHVVILPDNDDAGRNHAEKVAASLKGKAASVKIVRLPDVPEKEDVSYWLNNGSTLEQLQALAEAAAVEATNARETEVAGFLSTDIQVGDEGDDWVCLSDVQPEELEWLWFPYIPLGKLTLFDGDPGVGKSWATCAITAAVTKGIGLPDVPQTEPRNVLMLSAEDGLADTVRPRLDNLGADVTRVTARNKRLTLDEQGLADLESKVAALRPALVIIDPLFSFVGERVDIFRDNQVRSVTDRLAELARKYGCAIVALRHLTKQQQKALYAGGGSMGIMGTARSALLFGHDTEDVTNCGFVHVKSNIAEKGGCVGYRIEKTEDRRGRFYWKGDSDLTAEKILGFTTRRKVGTKLEAAVEFLSNELQACGLPQEKIERRALRAGISEATLKRAKAELKIKPYRPEKSNGPWWWKLPEAQEQTPGVQRAEDTNEHVADGKDVAADSTLSATIPGAQMSRWGEAEDDARCSNEHLDEQPQTTLSFNFIPLSPGAQIGSQETLSM